jgi:hypothetical protein
LILDGWNRIQMGNTFPKKEKKMEFFFVLDAFSRELEASPLSWMPFMEAQG